MSSFLLGSTFHRHGSVLRVAGGGTLQNCFCKILSLCTSVFPGGSLFYSVYIHWSRLFIIDFTQLNTQLRAGVRCTIIEHVFVSTLTSWKKSAVDCGNEKRSAASGSWFRGR